MTFPDLDMHATLQMIMITLSKLAEISCKRTGNFTDEKYFLRQFSIPFTNIETFTLPKENKCNIKCSSQIFREEHFYIIVYLSVANRYGFYRHNRSLYRFSEDNPRCPAQLIHLQETGVLSVFPENRICV